MVAAAVIAAGVATAAGSAIAGSESAGATTSAANTAAGEQNAALAQEKQLAAPYTAQGQLGIQTYNNLTSANPQTVQQTLQNTPGYQATYSQGVEGAQRAAAASGLNLSGNQLLGVESFGAQLGDSTYQQAISNATAQEQIGQAAAAGTAANVAGTANNLSSIAVNQGNNIANIDANEIAGITRAGSGAANQYLTYSTLNNLNNPAGGGNPQNLGGSTQVGAGGLPLTYDASGNITGTAPVTG